MKTWLLAAVSLLLRLSLSAQTLPDVKHPFVVIAHRGNHAEVPENTVAAITATYACGADYAELDLRTTKDGHLVLLHDATVNRTTNGKGKVSELTLAEVRQLTVNSKDGRIYRIPTFAEALAAAKGKINIYLDFKDADVAETWRQIKAAGMERRIIVYINEKEQYQPWRSIAPQLPLMTSLPEDMHTPAGLISFLDSFAVSVLDNLTDSSLLTIARQRNISVWLDAQSPSEGPAAWRLC